MNKLPNKKIALRLIVLLCASSQLLALDAQANLREDVFGAGARVKPLRRHGADKAGRAQAQRRRRAPAPAVGPAAAT